jgi:hypothetical protein
LPSFAIEQLHTLLQNIWIEEARQAAGIGFVDGEVLVSVSGGEVVLGGAPLDLILRKVDEVRGLFYRTIELLLNLPLRRRGSPSIEIQEQCRPWLFHAPPGSYQFAVRIQKPAQLPLWPDGMPEVQEVTQKFLDIVQASAQDPEGALVDIIPNKEYRETFLKLTRNLAPTGKGFEQLTIRSMNSDDTRPVVLLPSSREAINTAIKKDDSPKSTSSDQTQVQLKGILRGLQLDHDWLEITIPDQSPSTIRIFDAGDVVDDQIGPLVNRRVVIDAMRKQDGRHYYRDIQAEE